jgi:hypothetical protein
VYLSLEVYALRKRGTRTYVALAAYGQRTPMEMAGWLARLAVSIVPLRRAGGCSEFVKGCWESGGWRTTVRGRGVVPSRHGSFHS